MNTPRIRAMGEILPPAKAVPTAQRQMLLTAGLGLAAGLILSQPAAKRILGADSEAFITSVASTTVAVVLAELIASRIIPRDRG